MRLLFIIIFLQIGFNAQIISENEKIIRYRQQDNKVVEIPKNPQRVVVVYGSFAKVWDIAGGRVIGVPDLAEKSILPESMQNMPVVGSATSTNAEKILALNPDLVLLNLKTTKHPGLAELLRKTGVAAVCGEYDNL